MVCGNQLRAAEIEPLAAETRNTLIRLQQSLSGTASEAADHFRRNHGELPHQKRRTGGDFVLFGQTILRRPAFHHVADINILALQAHRFDHLREQFPRPAHERLTLHVFVPARPFAHEYQIRFRIADTENDLRAAGVQFAACAIRADVCANPVERVALDALIEERSTYSNWNDRR